MGTKNIFFLRKTFNCEVAARTHCSASWSCHQHRYPVSPRSQEHPDGSGCRFFLASQKPLPSSVAGKTQTCWLSHHQTFTSCKYRKLSWGLWVSRKNSTSLHRHYQFCIWRNFGTWVVSVKWYTRLSEVFMFFFFLAFFFCQQQKFVQWQMTAFFLRSSGDTGRGEPARTLELEEQWKQQQTFTEASPSPRLHYFL